MRPKFVLAVGLITVLILGMAFMLKSFLASPASPVSNIEPKRPEPAATTGFATSHAVMPKFFPFAPARIEPLTAEQQAAAIEAETDRLQELSMSDDPAALQAILADLANPEQEIREAAVEAAKQFGSRDAIPTLQAAAMNATDAEEKSALLEAADFLALPNLSDLAAANSPATPEQVLADEQNRNRQLEKHRAQAAPATIPAGQNSPTASDHK